MPLPIPLTFVDDLESPGPLPAPTAPVDESFPDKIESSPLEDPLGLSGKSPFGTVVFCAIVQLGKCQSRSELASNGQCGRFLMVVMNNTGSLSLAAAVVVAAAGDAGGSATL